MTTPEDIVRTLGRYQLIEEIGRGGMAVVYRAFDTTLKREVAVKLLHPHLASHGESRARFYREAQAVARLKHESVVEIYDYSGDEGDDVYIVMELIEGTTLRKLMEERKGDPLPSEAAALIIRPVLSALARAHAAGMIHRDVKPENILIGPDGAIKLSDFGIAHIAGMTEMTVTGQILGSPAYMSPEHVEMVELDSRADVFSVGIVLYELAVGRQPFAANSPHGVLKRIVEGRYDDPLSVHPAAGLPLAKILRRCLATNPEDRYESADSLIKDVDALLEEMEIDDPKAALKALLNDTNGWIAKIEPMVIARSLTLGIRAKKKRRPVEATAHFNRVLALDPGNADALAHVTGMRRNRRVRRILEIAAAVLTAATVLFAVGRAVFVPASPAVEPPSEEEPSLAFEHGEDPVADLESDTSDERIDTEGGDAIPADIASDAARIRRPRAGRQPQKSTPPEFREVVFTPHPLSVEIVINDAPPFPFGPAHRTQKLPVGRHKITFRPIDRKRFLEQTWTVDIPPGNGPFPFRGRLMWRPAELLVRTNVPASVTVPGRAADASGRPFRVNIKKGPSEQISVLISQEGYVPQTKQVTISAGEQTVLNVILVKSSTP